MENLLGAEGQGFNIAMGGLNGGRINIGKFIHLVIKLSNGIKVRALW